MSIISGAIAACTIKTEPPPLDNGAIGEGEYIEAEGNISVAFSVFSYRALMRYDSTLFNLDSTNAVALAWVRDTLQNPITDAEVVLYVDSMMRLPMVYIDTLRAYVAPIPKFFGHYYIAEVRTDDGFLRARFWNPTVGVDSIVIDDCPIEPEDTTYAPEEGSVIIYGLFPLDDRPVVLSNSDTLPVYAPYIILISIPSGNEHGAHMKMKKGFASTRDTIVFDAQMVETLFPYSNTTYEFYILVANVDTTTDIPAINPYDTSMNLRKILEIMKHAGIMTISDIFRFYVIK